MALTPEEKKARNREYRKANPDKVRAWRDNYRKKHPEQHRVLTRKRIKAYRARHPERVRVGRKRTWAKYYVRNRERLAENNKRWRKENPDKHSAQKKTYYKKNAERLRVISKPTKRRYLERHPERRHESTQQYYLTHREAHAERVKRWEGKHPEQRKAIMRAFRSSPKGRALNARELAKRRAKMREIVCTLTAAEWRTILLDYKFACAYCQRTDLKLTQDHVIPISKGGHHTKQNVVPACRSCNSKKLNRLNYRPELLHPLNGA